MLGVSNSGYVENMRRKGTDKPSKPGVNRRISNEALLTQDVQRTDGTRHSGGQGARAAHDARARHQGQGQARKFVVTTDSKHSRPIAQNLLQRNFTANAPSQVWTGDSTYIATDEGWLYLAVVLGLFSRQVVGSGMQPHMQSSLATDALRTAWLRRAPDAGVIFHSDRGSQYCGHEFQ